MLFCMPALGLAATVASSDANSVKEYLAKAEKLVEADKFDEALKLIDKALKVEPKNEPVLLLRADVFIKMNRADDAIKAYDKLIAMFPDKPDYEVGKMFLAGKMRRWEEALKLWDKSIQLHPNDVSVFQDWISKGQCLMSLNRHDEALKALEKASELEPNNKSVQKDVSGMLLRLNRKDNWWKVYGKFFAPNRIIPITWCEKR